MPKHNLMLAIFLLVGFATAILVIQVVRYDDVLAATGRYLIEDATTDHGNKNLMLGSSSIQRLGSKNILLCGPWLNRGIGSARISSLIRYLNLSKLVVEPSVVLVYAGENDISRGMSSNEIFDQYKVLIRQLQKKYPSSDIHILAIKLSPRWRARWDSFRAVNSLMRTYVRDMQSVFFHPASVPEMEFLETGFLDDGVHLTQQGYSLFTSGFNEACATQ